MTQEQMIEFFTKRIVHLEDMLMRSMEMNTKLMTKMSSFIPLENKSDSCYTDIISNGEMDPR